MESNKVKRTLNCPKGHDPKPFKIYSDTFSCDMVKHPIKKGEIAFGCRICNWDCCLDCYFKPNCPGLHNP